MTLDVFCEQSLISRDLCIQLDNLPLDDRNKTAEKCVQVILRRFRESCSMVDCLMVGVV